MAHRRPREPLRDLRQARDASVEITRKHERCRGDARCCYSLKADAQELKDIAKGPGSVTDKAKRAGDALRDPGAKGHETHASPRAPATDTPVPTAESPAPHPADADAPATPKPGHPPGA